MKKFIITFLTIFTMIVTMCTSVFASDIKAPALDSSQYDSYIVYSYKDNYGDEYYVCVVYMSADWTPYVIGNYIRWTKHRETAYVRYSSILNKESYDSSSNNGGWGTMNQYGYNQDTFFNVYSSNKDIYDHEGELFFQGLQLQEVVNLNLNQNLLPKVVGAMKILVACGVGCLALLTVLKMFGKVFAIFRV